MMNFFFFINDAPKFFLNYYFFNFYFKYFRNFLIHTITTNEFEAFLSRAEICIIIRISFSLNLQL